MYREKVSGDFNVYIVINIIKKNQTHSNFTHHLHVIFVGLIKTFSSAKSQPSLPIYLHRIYCYLFCLGALWQCKVSSPICIKCLKFGGLGFYCLIPSNMSSFSPLLYSSFSAWLFFSIVPPTVTMSQSSIQESSSNLFGSSLLFSALPVSLWPTKARPRHVFPIMLSSHPVVRQWTPSRRYKGFDLLSPFAAEKKKKTLDEGSVFQHSSYLCQCRFYFSAFILNLNYSATT